MKCKKIIQIGSLLLLFFIFFRFPKDPVVLAQWIHILKRKNFKPTSNTVLCSEHFVESDYLESSCKKKLLKKTALPSIFKFPSHLQTKVSCRRPVVQNVELPALPTEIEVVMNEEPNVKEVSTQTALTGEKLKQHLQKSKRQRKIFLQREKRRNAKIKSLKGMLKMLHANNIRNECLEQTPSENFRTLPMELFENEIKNRTKSKFHHNYSDEVKKFALTLHFYSPRAYKFIRKRCILPHPSRLHKYLSSKKYEPGVLTEVLDFLKDKILKGDDVSHLKKVALIFDAMAIRETRVYDPKLDKNVGYVNLGGIANDDSEQLATEALFFPDSKFYQAI